MTSIIDKMREGRGILMIGNLMASELCQKLPISLSSSGFLM